MYSPWTIISHEMAILIPRGGTPFGQHEELWPLGGSNFLEYAQSNHLEFSANQTCQTLPWACAEWQEACESQTSGIGPGRRLQFLVLTWRSLVFRDENDEMPSTHNTLKLVTRFPLLRCSVTPRAFELSILKVFPSLYESVSGLLFLTSPSFLMCRIIGIIIYL